MGYIYEVLLIYANIAKSFFKNYSTLIQLQGLPHTKASKHGFLEGVKLQAGAPLRYPSL